MASLNKSYNVVIVSELRKAEIEKSRILEKLNKSCIRDEAIKYVDQLCMMNCIITELKSIINEVENKSGV